MIKEQLFEDLYDKLPDVGNFVIFGACAAGEKILNDLKIYKPLTKVIGFIDNAVDGTFCSLPVWTLKEFTDFPKENYDMLIMGTRKDFSTENFRASEKQALLISTSFAEYESSFQGSEQDLPIVDFLFLRNSVLLANLPNIEH